MYEKLLSDHSFISHLVENEYGIIKLRSQFRHDTIIQRARDMQEIFNKRGKCLVRCVILVL